MIAFYEYAQMSLVTDITRSTTVRKFQFMTIRNERQFRALTGLSQKSFDTLLPEFTQCLESAREKNYK